MKVVINSCYGVFDLSPLAIQELAKKQGKECYFFEVDLENNYKLLTLHEAEQFIGYYAYSVPNPQDYNLNERAEEISIDYYGICRDDENLVAVVEELGEKACGAYTRFDIVEVPDGVDYEIKEYEGCEFIREKHSLQK